MRYIAVQPQQNQRYRLFATRAGGIFVPCALILGFLGSADAQTSQGKGITGYCIAVGGSSRVAGDVRKSQIEDWRTRFAENFAAFNENGHEYVVTDDVVLGRIQTLFKPELPLDKQKLINQRQLEINRLQESVNAQQGEVNRAQSEINEKQRLVDRGFESQSVVDDLQREVDDRQRRVALEQRSISDKQEAIHQEERSTNRPSTDAEIHRALLQELDAARSQGHAREVR
jgi:hypothetical protein